MIRRGRRQQKSHVDPGAAPVQRVRSGGAPRWVDVLFIALAVYAGTVTVWMLYGFGGPPVTHYLGLVSDLPAALASTTIAAALVMMRPDRSSPRATLVGLSAPSRCASCTRDSRNTS